MAISAKLLSFPHTKMYLAYLHTILVENFSNNLITQLQSIQPIINAAVQADPNKFYTYTQYQSNLTTDVGLGMDSARDNQLDEWQKHISSALADFTNTNPQLLMLFQAFQIRIKHNNIHYCKCYQYKYKLCLFGIQR
ncbi:MAG: hypothetical protein IPI19_16045 [Ignavibacteriales bacterium]|nr:hypothetical protein [Ignavibacteriales bacterium]